MEIYDIFLSYRRNGGFETAAYLYNLLQNDHYSVSFDIDTLRSGRFDEILLERIDNCTDFIVILDKNVFDRTLEGLDKQYDWLRIELGRAIEKGKNIIPIFLDGYVQPLNESLPEDISPITQYTGYSYNYEYFDAFYNKIKKNLICLPKDRQNRIIKDTRNELITDIEFHAKSGDLTSQKILGKYFWDNEDYLSSAKWYEMAAEQGDGMAKYLLACLMLNGKIPFKKADDILELLNQAASQDVIQSFSAIAVFYMNGYGGKRDYQEALKWLQKAISVGINENENMAICLQKLGRVEDALEIWEKEANNGSPVAQFHCGAFYFNGLGCEQNYTTAKTWFETAAAQENAMAIHGLANIYFDGLGIVKRDIEKGIELYKKAGSLGYPESYARLGSIYMENMNFPKCIEYFKLAARDGHIVAQFNLGILYCDGKHLKRDYRIAADYFLKAAKQGHGESQKMLGQLYQMGLGVPKNEEVANKWFELAKKQERT